MESAIVIIVGVMIVSTYLVGQSIREAAKLRRIVRRRVAAVGRRGRA